MSTPLPVGQWNTGKWVTQIRRRSSAAWKGGKKQGIPSFECLSQAAAPDPKANDATLLAKQKEISALREKLFDKMAQMMIEGRRILTPDQLAKLDQMGMERGMGMMHDGTMGGGMGHGM